MKIDATAAIMPPARQLILLGATLAKSKAGETKLATMLMPMVAVTKAKAPSKTATSLSMRATVAIGSWSISPNTGKVPETITTVTRENARKFTGSPQKLPRRTSDMLRQ
ncbi:hypothetical protein D3C84_772010 [compost metagenome]